MFNYVREHNIITEHQSGFQPIDSTVNQLLHIYHTIISNLDVGKLKMFDLCSAIYPRPLTESGTKVLYIK